MAYTSHQFSTFYGQPTKVKPVFMLILFFSGWLGLWSPKCSAELLFKADGKVTALAFSPRGRFLAVGTQVEYRPVKLGDYGAVGRIYLWDLKEHRLLRRLTRRGAIHSLAFSPDGHRLLSASGEFKTFGELLVWSVKTGRPLGRHYEEEDIPCLALSPDGRLVVCGTYLNLLWLDARTAKLKRQVKAHRWGDVYSVAFSPDGAVLASTGADGKIRLWHSTTGSLWRTWNNAGGNYFAYTADGKSLVIATGVLEVRDAETGTIKRTIRSKVPIGLLTLDPVGQRVATGSIDYNEGSYNGFDSKHPRPDPVQLWNITTGKLIDHFTGHQGNVTALAFSPHGTFIASGSEDQTIRLWTTKEHGSTNKAFAPMLAPSNQP